MRITKLISLYVFVPFHVKQTPQKQRSGQYPPPYLKRSVLSVSSAYAADTLAQFLIQQKSGQCPLPYPKRSVLSVSSAYAADTLAHFLYIKKARRHFHPSPRDMQHGARGQFHAISHATKKAAGRNLTFSRQLILITFFLLVRFSRAFCRQTGARRSPSARDAPASRGCYASRSAPTRAGRNS